MRVLINKDPYTYLDKDRDWLHRGTWPCCWVICKDAEKPPFVAAYRKKFSIDKDAQIRVHVSADERYELFLDGVRIGRGSERGDRENWFYETYDLSIKKGEHIIVARVWSLGDKAPFAQLTVTPGFIFSPEGEHIELLGTGVADWEAKLLGGYSYTDPFPAWGSGWNLDIDGGEFSWGWETGDGDGWKPVEILHNGFNGYIKNEHPPMQMLKPATLPAMMEQEISAGVVRFAENVDTEATDEIPVDPNNDISSVSGLKLADLTDSISVPAHTMVRAIVDLEDYYCAYSEVTVSGGRGGMVRVHWAESLYNEPQPQKKAYHEINKDDRSRINGKYFGGVGDIFRPDGGSRRKFDTLWWQAGRYIEVFVKTKDQPLTIDSFKLYETRYPMEIESSFEASDPRLTGIVPIAIRGLEMCSHETYMDCPYYEQMMYTGDTRLEVLTTYALSGDDRLPKKALRLYDASRLNSGITQSRYPSRVRQVITPFSLWWIGMVYDYSLWRDDPEYVYSLMPGVRAVIDCYIKYINDDGLIQAPNGWNFMDWVPGWVHGIPPEGEFGVSGMLNWQAVLVFNYAVQLERMIGEPEFAERNSRVMLELAENLNDAFWDEKRGLYNDDLIGSSYSEHTQCLALLSGLVPADKIERLSESLLSDSDLNRTTIYFTHYLFETYRVLGRIDALFDRLKLWYDLEKLGFKTTVEMPEPSRSDCHAWGAHPLYHYFASILGIRPASPGFNVVRIEPQLGPLKYAKGKLVHPQGEIEVDFRVENDEIKGTINLPGCITGWFVDGRKTIELIPGLQEV